MESAISYIYGFKNVKETVIIHFKYKYKSVKPKILN